MRALSENFLTDLKSGYLEVLTETVKSDTSLCLELRGNYINIYYRGGSLMKVQARGDSGTYSFSFDQNYFTPNEQTRLPNIVSGIDCVKEWLNASPRLKKAIDLTLAKTQKDEREFQQRILRDNNFGSIARSTDYYVCDIEYQNPNGRFDMVAVHWPSTSSERQKSQNRRLAFVEIKHGDGALEGTAGVWKHIEDVNTYASTPENLDQIKKDMIDVFNQKLHLGLIDCGKELKSFSNEKPLLFLAFVNHDPGKSKLRDLLQTACLPASPYVDLHIVTASFLGYGLYDEGVHTIPDAWNYFSKYIYHENQ